MLSLQALFKDKAVKDLEELASRRTRSEGKKRFGSQEAEHYSSVDSFILLTHQYEQ